MSTRPSRAPNTSTVPAVGWSTSRRPVRASSCPSRSVRATPTASAPAPRGSTTTRTASSTSSSPTTCSGARTSDLWCSLDGATKSYCTPESYKGTSSKLYRNLGGGKFEDASQQGRPRRPQQQVARRGRARLQRDGWPDIFVANDTQPNKLYRNNKNGTFADEAAVSGRGLQRGAAWPAAPWASTRPTTTARAVRTCWSATSRTRCSALYHNEGSGVFVDEAPRLRRRPGEPADARLRRLLLRLRPRRPARHLRGQRPHRGGDQPRAADASSTSSRRCCSATSGKGKFENAAARLGRARPAAWWRAARPTATIDRDGDLDVAGDHEPRPGLSVPQRRRQP